MPTLQRLAICLSVGFILFFYSERLFWTVIWPGTSFPQLLLTWLIYSAAAYLFLAIVTSLRTSDAASTFLAGAMYGWLIEGGVANTLYGTEASAPFPLSVSLTALSWHAPLSVMVGWYATRRAFAAATIWPMLILNLSVGLFWGAWAMFPRQESPPIMASPAAFAWQAIAWTTALAASWALLLYASLPRFQPGRYGLAIWTSAIGLFYFQHAQKLGWIAIVLPALLIVAIALLAVRREARSPPEFPDVGASWRRFIPFAAMPLAATAVFTAGIASSWDRLSIASMVYAIGGPAGFIALAAAIYGCLRKRP